MKKFFFLTVTLLFTIITNAQTPPAKTWYYNNYGTKTTVKEKWSEDNTGVKHGAYILYDVNGNRLMYGSYNHGKKTGRWEEVQNSNILYISMTYLTISNWNNDILHGEYQLIRTSVQGKPTAIVETQGQYLNNVKTGFWKENYDIYTKICQQGNYKNDLRDGKWLNTSQTDINKNPETILNYHTTYSNGEIISSFDDKGVDLFEKYQKELILRREREAEESRINAEKEKTKQLNDKMQNDFYLAMNEYSNSNNSGKYTGDISGLTKFLNTYSSTNINPQLIEQAKTAIQNKPDNDAFYKYYERNYNSELHLKNFNGYIEYQKQFPEGIHISEVKEELKKIIVKNKGELLDTIIISLQKRNVLNALELCEGVLKYKDNIPANTPIFVIFYSLALWSNGNKDKAIEVVKPYVNTIIHYSDGDKKFMDTYLDYYKLLKNSLNIENDTETYKTIKSLK